MKLVVQPAIRPLSGTVVVPGDKSIGHRALLFSLLSQREVRVRGLGDGADNGRSARAITALGARVTRVGDELAIVGTGLGGMRAPDAPIDCGNSGTTIRLLCGLLAGQPFATTLHGDESLSKRPMRRVIEPLARMGAVIAATADGTPPLVVGPAARALAGIDYTLPMASAQVKTAILLAALYADDVTRVTEPGPSRDHTERMLAHLGAPLAVDGRTTTIDPRGWDRRLAASRLDVPGDPSSAAFLVAAPQLARHGGSVELPGICVNPTRTGFLDVMRALGLDARHGAPTSDGGEPVARVTSQRGGGGAKEVTIAGDLAVRAIDEIPMLAVLCARWAQRTIVRDAGELRVKESDRIATTCRMLRAFGVACSEDGDGFTIDGRDRPFAAARIDAEGDHRIAMAAAVGALGAEGECVIDSADNVATSYPGFAAALTQLGAEIRQES